MGVIDDLVANNRTFAAALPSRHLDVRPSRRPAIGTCMDSRLDVFAARGLDAGEAHALRNAGHPRGDAHRPTTAAWSSSPTTACAPSSRGDRRRPGLRDRVLHRFRRGRLPVDPPRRPLPFVLHQDRVRGFVYDLDTHRLREVLVEPEPTA